MFSLTLPFFTGHLTDTRILHFYPNSKVLSYKTTPGVPYRRLCLGMQIKKTFFSCFNKANVIQLKRSSNANNTGLTIHVSLHLLWKIYLAFKKFYGSFHGMSTWPSLNLQRFRSYIYMISHGVVLLLLRTCIQVGLQYPCGVEYGVTISRAYTNKQKTLQLQLIQHQISKSAVFSSLKMLGGQLELHLCRHQNASQRGKGGF